MKLTEGGKLDRPNVCTICERTPAIGSAVVDTERYFDGYPHNLQGKRYVCERCIKDMIKLVQGDVDAAEYQRVVAERDEYEATVKSLKKRMQDVSLYVADL